MQLKTQEDIEKLKSIISLQNKMLENLRESNEFYANKGHWKYATGDRGTSYETRQSVPDYELTQSRGPHNVPDTRIFTGGKLARIAHTKDLELQKEMEKLK